MDDCCWCGEPIYPDEKRHQVAVYDGEFLVGYEHVCEDCYESWDL